MVGTYQFLFYNRQTNLLYIYIHGAAARLLSHLWLIATPWTVTCQAPLFMKFSRQEYRSGLWFPPPGCTYYIYIYMYYTPVISSVTQSCPTLQPHGLRHARPPCPSPTSGVYSNSCPFWMEFVMPSNHLILCRPLLLLPSIFPSIRVFSNESALHIRWPKY